MNSLIVAVLFVAAVASASAGIIAPALGLASARGALEGALGGQWISDAAVPQTVVAAPALAAPALAAPLGYAAPLGVGIAAPAVLSRGAVEGALGGQWIPDAAVPEVAAPAVVAAPALAAAPLAYSAPLGLAAPLGVGLAAPVLSRGALEGALGGQWIPDVLGK